MANNTALLRRDRPAGPWQDVATAIETRASLTDQPRGKEYEYRIIAVFHPCHLKLES
jgi:hypothetical protein